MRTVIARIAQGVLPQRQWIQLQSVRSRNRQMRWLKENGVLELAQRFSDSNGSAVLHGPFAGMKYPAESILSRHSVPRLLGSYESELHDVIGIALGEQYDRVIDIGTAEGYYAVGFALKGRSPVVTFETDPREMALCQEMALLNKVEDRITSRDLCNPEALRALTAGKRCFVLSDCEGYEAELFDAPTIQALRRSDVLVEIHLDDYEPFFARFAETHSVRNFAATARSGKEYPELACLAGKADLGICEFRPAGQHWLYARSHRPD
jgi:predicted RNA methylase